MQDSHSVDRSATKVFRRVTIPEVEPAPPMKIAVVIVNYRTPALAMACLESVGKEREALPDLKAVVVDNLSGDNSIEVLSKAIATPTFADWVEFMPLPLNGGFGWGNNQAILHLLSENEQLDAILLLNPDARILPGAIAALARDLTRHPDAGAIGSQLVNEDGSLSGSAFRFPTIAREFMRGCNIGPIARLLCVAPTLIPFGVTDPIDWVTGASVLLRASALRESGLFDTGFFLYFEEVELMHRLRAKGWKCYHCPDSRVIHIAGAATGVVNGKSNSDQPPPDYVFLARRRYFALTHGRLAAFLANLAWLTGDMIGRFFDFVMPGRRPSRSRSERAALLRLGLVATERDARPAISSTEDRAGEAPRWLAG